VNATGSAHQEMLRALNSFLMDLEQVRLLKRLKAKVVVIIIALVVDGGIKSVRIAENELPDICCNQRSIPTLIIDVLKQCAAGLHK